MVAGGGGDPVGPGRPCGIGTPGSQRGAWIGWAEWTAAFFPDPGMLVVPFKLNQHRRRHIPRARRRVTNWPAYDASLRCQPAMPACDASLRQRGSLTVWFTDNAITGWAAAPRTTRGGQLWYSPLAILTALTLRAVFRLAYR